MSKTSISWKIRWYSTRSWEFWPIIPIPSMVTGKPPQIPPGPSPQVSTIAWSTCSRYLVVGSVDMTVRILSREPEEGFTPCTLTGHKRAVVGAWFGPEGAHQVVSVSADGGIFLWECSPANGLDTLVICIGFGLVVQADLRDCDLCVPNIKLKVWTSYQRHKR